MVPRQEHGEIAPGFRDRLRQTEGILSPGRFPALVQSRENTEGILLMRAGCPIR
jgi:hypothetical protein